MLQSEAHEKPHCHDGRPVPERPPAGARKGCSASQISSPKSRVRFCRPRRFQHVALEMADSIALGDPRRWAETFWRLGSTDRSGIAW